MPRQQFYFTKVILFIGKSKIQNELDFMYNKYHFYYLSQCNLMASLSYSLCNESFTLLVGPLVVSLDSADEVELQ